MRTNTHRDAEDPLCGATGRRESRGASAFLNRFHGCYITTRFFSSEIQRRVVSVVPKQ